MSGRPIENGMVVVTGDTITAVGTAADLPPPPPDAKLLSFPTHTLVPGFIDAASGILAHASDIEEMVEVEPALSSADALDPFDRLWKDAVAEGVTAAYVSIGPRAPLAGSGAVVRLSGAVFPPDLVLARAAHVEGSLWPDATSFRPPPEPERSFFFYGLIFRMTARFATNFDLLDGYRSVKAAFLRAQAYQRRRAWYQQDLGAWERELARLKQEEAEARKEGKTGPPRPPPPRPAEPSRDASAEALLPVLAGQTRLRILAESAEEIRLALALAREFSIKVVLCGAFEAHLLAPEIAEAGASVVLVPFEPAESLRDELSLTNRAAAALARAEIPFCFGTGAPPERAAHLLRRYACRAVGRGLDPDYALRAVTLTAAEMLGVADRIGSIAPGKEAHLVVFEGPPLLSSSAVSMAMVRGKIVFQKGGEGEKKGTDDAKKGDGDATKD